MNCIVLVGRLVADPELRTTQSGVPVCSFRIAVDRRFASQSGERQADFIPCVAWRQQAEFVSRYFSKGRLIGVQGSLQSRSYDDQQGNRRTAYEVQCDQVQFVGSKSESGGGQQSGAFSGGGYGGGFDAPPAPAKQQNVAYQSGGIDDFQEITSDEDLPF